MELDAPTVENWYLVTRNPCKLQHTYKLQCTREYLFFHRLRLSHSQAPFFLSHFVLIQRT